MAGRKVLLEIVRPMASPFDLNEAAFSSPAEASRQTFLAAEGIAGPGVEIEEASVPVPMLIAPDGTVPTQLESLAAGPSIAARGDMTSETVVVAAEVTEAAMQRLRERADVQVWENSELTLYQAAAVVDCRPFKPAVSIQTLQQKLGVSRVWKEGHEGEQIIVGIVDEGVSRHHYPVVGGFSLPGAQTPGSAPVTSHGSMCAADVLVAAPSAKLYDYPFLGVPNSGGALQMFQAILNQRTRDGTPHVANNSYGFVGIPDPVQFPNHEVNNLNHPLHRKVREVIAAGVVVFFAAGNCGQNCPSGVCHISGIGPGKSIHASNSLQEVITIAAVNSVHDRIGYSSQGPGRFSAQKPDLSSYSHFFGNFGPGRPAGGTSFDNGTSAASPVAAGVAALLLSASLNISPALMKQAMIASAIAPPGAAGWNADFGHGIVNAEAAYDWLLAQGVV